MAISRQTLAAAVAAALAYSVSAQPRCDVDSACQFSTTYKGDAVKFDLRRLCNANADYQMTDAVGHTYYAQICGRAGKACLPADWENQYEYGRVIQTWGSAPLCGPNNPPTCVEEDTSPPQLVCCSEPCQVIGTNQPTFSTVVPGDPTQGIVLTYLGEQPTSSDPYSCDYDPTTGQPYHRVTHLQFFCDPDVQGFANLFEVDQNSTDDCDYTLKFKTNAVCMGSGLSGGWTFVIVMASLTTLFVVGSSFKNFRRTGTWDFFPHKEYVNHFLDLVVEGIAFTLAGCRKPRRSTLLGDSGVKSSSSSSSGAAATASPAFSSGGGYQSVGASESSVDRSAYTDL